MHTDILLDIRVSVALEMELEVAEDVACRQETPNADGEQLPSLHDNVRSIAYKKKLTNYQSQCRYTQF